MSPVFSALPGPVRSIRELMSTFSGTWFLCGGWAVDAWLGRQNRDHADIDVAVLLEDQDTLFGHLTGWRLIAHDPHVPGDSTEIWNGRPLDLPAHIHARSSDGVELEVLLNARSNGDLLLSSEPRVAIPLHRSARRSPWGLPTATPEVLLFFKATAYFGSEKIGDRPHDEVDFHALWPGLSHPQRRWLRDAIALVHPEHPWLLELPDGAAQRGANGKPG